MIFNNSFSAFVFFFILCPTTKLGICNCQAVCFLQIRSSLPYLFLTAVTQWSWQFFFFFFFSSFHSWVLFCLPLPDSFPTTQADKIHLYPYSKLFLPACKLPYRILGGSPWPGLHTNQLVENGIKLGKEQKQTDFKANEPSGIYS